MRQRRARCALRAARPLHPGPKHAAYRASIPAPAAAASASDRVDLPSGQGITGLPLANLYAELGRPRAARGFADRRRDFAVVDPAHHTGAGGGARASCTRCSARRRARHPHVPAPSRAPAIADLRRAAAASRVRSVLPPEPRSRQTTGCWAERRFGRRAADHEATGIMGRRSSDRCTLIARRSA